MPRIRKIGIMRRDKRKELNYKTLYRTKKSCTTGGNNQTVERSSFLKGIHVFSN